MICALFKGLLARHCHLRVARTGQEGLRALADEPLDVLLSDLNLGDLPGETLADFARAQQRPPHVLLMSGESRRLARAAVLARRTFTKPFPIGDLLEELEACRRERARAGS
jgi:DNA-binding response OmpR family regulator